MAFFSKKLSLTEHNYNIGKQDLLAVNLALAEWCHWLEGAQHPFMIYTGHKKFEYIKTTNSAHDKQGGSSFLQGLSSPSPTAQDPRIQKLPPYNACTQPLPRKWQGAYLSTSLFCGGSYLGVQQGDWKYPRTENPQSVSLIPTHLFQNYRITENIMSDQGAQFSSWVWSRFTHLFSRLTSGYHPQASGREGQSRNRSIPAIILCR